ncbi:hypothetical protein KIW84_064873 [Lathyrus oleraceus]|uniref:Uncharacterized protein n=1 Tax=Pisum sativum TaxID=3888 RepID=A0A9D4WF92_PEA|nr:hypothetical protein KIW84_064873 [Pisum sativum]
MMVHNLNGDQDPVQVAAMRIASSNYGQLLCLVELDSQTSLREQILVLIQIVRNGMCLSCLVQNLVNACASIFRRGEALSTSSSLHKTTSMTSASSLDNSLSDMFRSPPRPLPYDAEPLNSADKWNECAREDELKIYRSKSASRASISKTYTWSWACLHVIIRRRGYMSNLP